MMILGVLRAIPTAHSLFLGILGAESSGTVPRPPAPPQGHQRTSQIFPFPPRAWDGLSPSSRPSLRWAQPWGHPPRATAPLTLPQLKSQPFTLFLLSPAQKVSLNIPLTLLNFNIFGRGMKVWEQMPPDTARSLRGCTQGASPCQESRALQQPPALPAPSSITPLRGLKHRKVKICLKAPKPVLVPSLQLPFPHWHPKRTAGLAQPALEMLQQGSARDGCRVLAAFLGCCPALGLLRAPESLSGCAG